MSALEFGQLVEAALEKSGISQRRLASRLGELPDGSVFDSTQIRLIRQGRRGLTHDLVTRLIDLLALDPADAWSAAGLWPPDLTAQEYRQHRVARRGAPSPATTDLDARRQARADRPDQGEPLNPGKVSRPGHRPGLQASLAAASRRPPTLPGWFAWAA